MLLGQRTKIVPDVHLAAERADLDDGLAQEIVGLALEMLLHPRLDVVVLVPHAHLDAVGGVVALAARAQAGRERERAGVRAFATEDTRCFFVFFVSA